MPTFEAGLDKPLKRIAHISRSLQNDKKELIKEVDEKNDFTEKIIEEKGPWIFSKKSGDFNLQWRLYSLNQCVVPNI